jgi:hypothetical protein
MKHMVASERVDLENVVLNVVVREEFVLNMNAVHVDMKNEQLGRIIQEIVHVMVMVVKHLMNNVMIVRDEVINKKIKETYEHFFFFISITDEKKTLFFTINQLTVDSDFSSVLTGGGGGGGIISVVFSGVASLSFF